MEKGIEIILELILLRLRQFDFDIKFRDIKKLIKYKNDHVTLVEKMKKQKKMKKENKTRRVNLLNIDKEVSSVGK